MNVCTTKIELTSGINIEYRSMPEEDVLYWSKDTISLYIYIFVSLDRKENKYIVSTQTNTLTHRESILRARVDFESKESGLSGSKVT